MSSMTISVFDGVLPIKIAFDEVPRDFNALFAEVARQFPERSKPLVELSFNEDETFLQAYTILLNRKHVHSRDQVINPGDEITILGNLAGG
jgi:molybdopterin converting factor small subunit